MSAAQKLRCVWPQEPAVGRHDGWGISAWAGWVEPAAGCGHKSMTHHTWGLLWGQRRLWLRLQMCQHCLRGAWAGLRLSSPVDGVCMLNRPHHDLQHSTQMSRRDSE